MNDEEVLREPKMFYTKTFEEYRKEWIFKYNKYLTYMYNNIFINIMKKDKNIKYNIKEVTFEEFCNFSYKHSSKYISEYL